MSTTVVYVAESLVRDMGTGDIAIDGDEQVSTTTSTWTWPVSPSNTKVLPVFSC